MQGHRSFGKLAALCFALLTGGQCTQLQQVPPRAWSVVDTLVNSNTPDAQPGDARTILYFSTIPWQDSNPRAAHFARGWMNDVLVKNPLSFQVRVDGGQLLQGGLIVRDATTHVPLQTMTARANHGYDCGPPLPPANPGDPPKPSGTIQCFNDPGQARFVARAEVPKDVAVYTVELVQMCRGRPQIADLRCPATVGGDPNGPQATLDAMTVLTISPPVRPAAPAHGQKFDYELVSRTAQGEAVTRITAIYVNPGDCALDSLQATPIKDSVGKQVNVQWFIRKCHSYQVTSSDTATPTISSRSAALDTASEADFNGSRAYQLTKNYYDVTFRASAFDAMGRRTPERSVSVAVEPCSISPTDPRCETRCRVTPAPAGCPQPPPPVCPVGQGDENRQRKNYTVIATCVYGPTWAEQRTLTEAGCTEAEAQQTARGTLGPSCSVLSGPPVTQACPNGASKKDWKFCLACANPNAMPDTYNSTANACYLPDAVEAAKLNYPSRTCWLQQQGDCPK